MRNGARTFRLYLQGWVGAVGILVLTAGLAGGLPARAQNPAASSHKPVFYDNDFRYLLRPETDSVYLGDQLKRLCLGPCITYDVGGQFRLRYHGERNMRGLGLTGRDDDFLLYRTRLYTNVEIAERFRFYFEGIDAVSNYEDFPPRPIEENRADVLNLFGDVQIWEGAAGSLSARLGRQELIYGAQRTVSPLDWANTRRTFEGYKLFWQSEQWNVDAFWVRPVAVNAKKFDSPDYDQEFWGLYATRKWSKQNTWDIYYLRLENERDDFEFDTLGTRLAGERGLWSYEAELDLQLGKFQGRDHQAGSWTLGLGRKFPELPWSPALWAYYDWASGSRTQGNGYHHLFPLAHKYLGHMDLFGRRNIESPNVQLTLSPCDRLKLAAWYYVFFLESTKDVPYTVVMSPFNGGNPPADSYLGQEIDLTATWQLSPRADILFGYSPFFAGDYYKDTPGLVYRGDADFFYTQFTLNF
ncbi:MAG: alginate export family protein [Thermogutta sp.]